MSSLKESDHQTIQLALFALVLVVFIGCMTTCYKIERRTAVQLAPCNGATK